MSSGEHDGVDMMGAQHMLRFLMMMTLLGALVACGADPADPAPSGAADALATDAGSAGDAAAGDVAAGEDTSFPDPAVKPVPLTIVDLAAEVDPMIGSGGSGNVIPGALIPHGMVRASPDTVDAAGAIGTYHHDAKLLRGFSHTHLEGPGGSNNGYGEVLVMPFAGTITKALPDHAAPFDHADETTEPGYYAVTLGDSGIRVELTATGHAAVHRYTFPATKPSGPGLSAGLLIDLGMSNGRSDDGEITQVSKREVQGWGGYNVHPALGVLLDGEPTGGSQVYFYLRFDRDLTGVGAFSKITPHVDGQKSQKGAHAGLWTHFDATSGPVEVGVGISFISVAQAKLNLETEVGDASQPRFDAVKKAARDTWNRTLSRVQIEGGDATRRKIFYTALYHSHFQPADYTEVGGKFHSAFDGTHHSHNAKKPENAGRTRRFYTDDWCMWDTYRTLHPLGTLLEPEIRSDISWSMLHAYTEGGWLPKCTWHATGYSRVMTGNPAVVIMADALLKDLYNDDWHALDLDLAWKAMKKTLDGDNANPGAAIFCGYLNLGTVPDYLKLGWVPGVCDSTQSASMTLEYANADWAAARWAQKQGLSADQARYDKRAGNWKNHWNPAVGFMQAKDKAGAWITPFDPTTYAKHFVEATSWIFTFFVPHDPAGLAEALGGIKALDAKLDGFFAAKEFDISNQPSFHIPWLYGRAGQPEKAQDKVHETLATRFTDKVNGLPGNDDAGSTSAWYVLGALGLYPLSPGDGVWELGAPMFKKVTLWLPTSADAKLGRQLVIEGPGVAATQAGGTKTGGTAGKVDVHVTTATLRGLVLPKLRVSHTRLVKGGVLRLTAAK